MLKPGSQSAWGGQSSLFSQEIKAGFGGWGLRASLYYLALWERNVGRDCVVFSGTCGCNLHLDIIIFCLDACLRMSLFFIEKIKAGRLAEESTQDGQRRGSLFGTT